MALTRQLASSLQGKQALGTCRHAAPSPSTPTLKRSPTACSSTKGDATTAPVVPSRREALGVSALVASVLVTASPAQAFLGIGEDGDAKLNETYLENTKKVIEDVKMVLAMDKKDPNKEEAVKELRKEINTWVANYRREAKVAGRPSFGTTYSILNALAGHFNSFGPTTPIPKKRLERIEKELKDVDLYIKRGR